MSMKMSSFSKNSGVASSPFDVECESRRQLRKYGNYGGLNILDENWSDGDMAYNYDFEVSKYHSDLKEERRRKFYAKKTDLFWLLWRQTRGNEIKYSSIYPYYLTWMSQYKPSVKKVLKKPPTFSVNYTAANVYNELSVDDCEIAMSYDFSNDFFKYDLLCIENLSDCLYFKQQCDKYKFICSGKYSAFEYDNEYLCRFATQLEDEIYALTGHKHSIARNYNFMLRKKRMNNSFYKYKEQLNFDVPNKPSENYFDKYNRSPKLLYRLYSRIKDFTIARLKKFFPSLVSKPFSPLNVNFEMESVDAHGVEQVAVTKQSNVVLTNSEGTSIGKPVDLPSQPMWHKWCTSEDVVPYSNLSNRFLYINTLVWSTNYNGGSELERYDFPRNALTSLKSQKQKMCQVPNIIPFTIHRYWRGDIEIKVQVNSNKFQVGQLQVSWLYAANLDDKIKDRENIWSLSQTDHALVNAGSSNECKLYIPYKYYKPFLSTKYKNYERLSLVLGRCYIKVLNKLNVVKDGPEQCSVSIFVRFPNSVFSGMIDGQIDEIETLGVNHEMEMVGALGALKMLDILSPCNNMDNPPRPQAPMYVVPTASHSWSVGNDLSEPLHSLRLGGRGQTPHPFECSKGDTVISKVISVFGLIHQHPWKKDDKSGKLLFKYEASPLLGPGEYPSKSVTENNLDLYYMPPVAVISSMFALWRGSIEFKFDIVCTQFHSGRLLVAYIPGVNEDSVTLEQARNSAYVVFDLSSSHSFTFKVPYIADKPWWPRRYTGNAHANEYFAPSSIYFFVLNPLVPMDSVPDVVEINVYMRAGHDFELSIPVQPCLGLGWNTQFAPYDINEIFAVKGYAPYYAGRWQSFLNETKLCMRWGQYADQIAHFQPLDPKLFYLKISDSSKAPLAVKPVTEDGKLVPKLVPCEWAVVTNAGEGRDYYFMVPFTEEAGAKLCCKELLAGEHIGTRSGKYMFDGALTTTENTFSNGNPGWLKVGLEQDFEIVGFEMERESSENILDPTNDLLTTGFGRYSYGERFTDLKDICRRYQLYGSKMLDSTSYDNTGRAMISFPILPQGLKLDINYEVVSYSLDPKTKKKTRIVTTQVNEVANRCRDGIIPICCSGFRYYRGSIRFRIVLPSTDFVNVWIQHRPDYMSDEQKISVISNVVDATTIYNHGYSMYIQNLEVNSVVEFEVPFYQCGMYGLLQTPLPLHSSSFESNRFYSLGDIVLGLTFGSKSSMNSKSMTIQIFYSMGDDMEFNTFQGFPPMVYLDEVRNKLASMSVSHEMKRFINKTVTGVSDDITGVVESRMDKITRVIEDGVATIKQDACKGVKYTKDIIVSAISQIVHCIIHPNIKTYCWALASFLCALGLIAFEGVSIIYSHLTKFCTAIFSHFKISDTVPPPSEQQEGVGVVKHEILFQEGSTLLIVLFSTICTAMGVVSDNAKAVSWGRNLLTNIGGGSRMAVNLLYLFNNLSDIIQKMMRWCMSKISKDASLYLSLDEEIPDVKLWCKRVCELSDLKNRSHVLMSEKLQTDVDDCFQFGTILLLRMSEHSIPGGGTIKLLYDKISELRDELLTAGKCPLVRKEPFVLWISGSTRVGKSHLSTTISAALMKSVNYTTSKEMMLTIQPTSKYWNNCNHQPVLYVDDMFSVTMGETLEAQCNTLFMVKSSSILNPPMASVEDKKMRYNPEVFYINSNFDFPVLNGVPCLDALYSRRDLLVKVEFKRSFMHNGKMVTIDENIKIEDLRFNDYPQSVYSKYGHLNFFIGTSPSSFQKNEYEGPYDFDQFIAILTGRYKKFFAEEQVNFKQRVELMYCLRPEMEMDDIDETTLAEQFTLYRDSILESADMLVKQNYLDVTGYLKDTYARAQVEVQKSMDYMKRRYRSGVTFSKGLSDKIRWHFTLNLPVLDDDSPPSTSTNPFLSNYAPEQIASPIFDILNAGFEINTNPVTETSGVRVKYHQMCEQYIYRDNASLKQLFSYCCLHCTEEELSVLDAIPDATDLLKNRPNTKTLLYRTVITLARTAKVSCVHYNLLSLNTISYDSVKEEYSYKIMGATVTVGSQRCNGGMCVVNNFLIWRLLNEHIVLNSPSLSIYYRKNVFKELPKCLEKTYIKPSTYDNIVQELDVYKQKLKLVFDKYINPMFQKIYNFLKNNLSGILTAITCILGLCVSGVAMGVGVSAFKSLVRPPLHTVSSEMINSGDIVNVRPPKMFIAPKHVSFEVENAQINAMCGVIMRNSVYISWVLGVREVKARCLFIKDRHLLILKHYMEEFKHLNENYPGGTFKIRFINNLRVNQAKEVETHIGDFLSLPVKYFGDQTGECVSNFGLIEMPDRIPPCKDIIKYFIPYSQSNKVSNKVALLEMGELMHTNLEMTKRKIRISSQEHYSPVYLVHSYTYNEHGYGKCGSILIDLQNSQNPVIGMHVGGANGIGVSEPLFREMFTYLKNVGLTDVSLINLVEENSKTAPLNSNIIPLGKVDPKLAHFESGLTRIIPSEIQGVFPIRTGPAPLRTNDPRLLEKISPMISGCEKHGMPPLMFPPGLVDECEQDMYELLIAKCKPIRNKVDVVSLETTILGDPNVPYFDSLSWDTSEGFPFSSERPPTASNKSWLFELNRDVIPNKLLGIHKKLYDVLLEKHDQREKSILPCTVFVDCLKDARISTEKIPLSGKTRIFSISPVDFTIQFKQYYLDFLSSYMSNRFDLEHMVGVNTESREWTLLYDRLSEKGTTILTGDYKNFGPGLNSEVANACLRIIIKWYKYYGASPTHLHHMQIMAREIINAKHLCFDLVYTVLCGIPSGSPITTPLNSLVNCMYVRIMWKLIMSDNKINVSTPKELKNGVIKYNDMSSFVNFNKHVTLYTYGDDLIMNVSDEVKEIFNNVSLNEYFGKFMIVYTDSNKGENIEKYTTLDKATFLKRSFNKHPWRSNVYIAGLDKSSIEDCANWVWNSNNAFRESSIVNSQMSCDLAYGWGPDYHAYIVSKIKEAWCKNKVQFHCKGWKELDFEKF